ncbi:hypothetical protein ACFL2H_03775 [Planctomycetota bacterium]
MSPKLPKKSPPPRPALVQAGAGSFLTWISVGLAAATALVCVVGGIGFALYYKYRSDDNSEVELVGDPPYEKQVVNSLPTANQWGDKSSTTEKSETKPSGSADGTEVSETSKQLAPTSDKKSEIDDDSDIEKTSPSDLSSDSDELRAPDRRSPFEAIHQDERFLDLPPIENNLVAFTDVELAPLAAVPQETELELLGMQEILGRDRFSLVNDSPDETTKTWSLMIETSGGFSRKYSLAVFSIRNGRLYFRWTRDAARSSECRLLKYCMIRIQVKEDGETFFLSRPESVNPIDKIDLSRASSRIRIPIELEQCPDSELLKLQIVFDLPGVAFHRLETLDPLSVNAPNLLTIFSGSDDNSQRLIDAELKFRTTRQMLLDMRCYEYRIANGVEDRQAIDLKPRSKRSLPSRNIAKLLNDLQRTKFQTSESLQRIDQRFLAEQDVRRKQTLESTRKKLETKLASIDAERIKLEKSAATNQSTQQIREILATVRQSGEMHFRVFIDIEGNEVEIVKTRDFATNDQ